MFGHLRDEALLDLVEGRSDPGAQRHLAACGECRARVEEARAALGLASEAEVPEPSPLYWESFRQEVGRRLAEPEPARSALRLPAFAALAAALVLAIGLALRAPAPAPSAAPMLPAWTPLPEDAEDVGAEVIGALAAATEDAGAIDPCRGLQCFETLTEEESRVLAAALAAELGGRTL